MQLGRIMKKRMADCFAAALIIFLAAQAANACPLCKEALFDPGQLGEKIATAKGYAISIWILLSVPFILIASVTALVVRHSRKAAPALSRVADRIDTPDYRG